MLEKIRVIFTIPELRNRILLTLLLIAIYRVGYQIPLPILNQGNFGSAEDADEGGLGKLLQQASMFSGANLRQITVFGLGIMPYISASIILQLLASVWKPLEELKKEGETGRKKINEYTRYLTVVLCLVQSIFYLSSMTAITGNSTPAVHENFLRYSDTGQLLGTEWGWFVTAILTMTCGTVFLMWIGEQIDEYGIGNGISLLIMAGILAQMPGAIQQLAASVEWRLTRFDTLGIETVVLLMALFVAVVFGVVFITLGKRSIPVQSAKHVRGRRVFGGNRQGLMLRINQAGVMPIIFASSLLMLPSLLFNWLASQFVDVTDGSVADYFRSGFTSLADLFSRGTSFFYNLLYIGMIYFFCYFWTAITFNPKEMAENLKEYGTFIPGYRPGRRTADYLENVMTRITFVGAGFLSLVAIVPTVISSSLGIPSSIASFYGGTALLIAVSVAFDLVQKIDSHLVMRNYRGLLES